jgi:hypothetical protein
MAKGRASGSGSDIYGSDPQDAASSLSGDALGQLSGAGDNVDVHGVKDSRVNTKTDSSND